jgi:hypothetical protein
MLAAEQLAATFAAVTTVTSTIAMVTTVARRDTAAIVAAATIATVTGDRGVAFTTQQGDADDREENRDAKNQCTIHQKFSN